MNLRMYDASVTFCAYAYYLRCTPREYWWANFFISRDFKRQAISSRCCTAPAGKLLARALAGCWHAELLFEISSARISFFARALSCAMMLRLQKAASSPRCYGPNECLKTRGRSRDIRVLFDAIAKTWALEKRHADANFIWRAFTSSHKMSPPPT